MVEELDSVESVKDIEDDAKRWISEIQLAIKESEDFWKVSKRIVRRYRGQKAENVDYFDTGMSRRYNIFWSNVQTLQPSLYARTPKARVERRHKDKDPIGRLASELLERSLSYCISSYDFDSLMKAIRDDYLIVGRGTAWVRYSPHFEKEKVETQINDEPIEEVERVAYEEVVCDYIHWRDFIHSSARNWDEVRWVARRAYMTRDALVKRFGEEIGKDIPLDYSPIETEDKKEEDKYDFLKRAEVWEVWDKESQKVYWVSCSYNKAILDSKEDPLGLRGFFPCPRPLLSTITNDSLFPVADYLFYKDQAEELDEVTSRINLLEKSIKVAGVYDASVEALQRLADEAAENMLIPVPDWMGFSQKGGFQGCIQFMPFKEAVDALMVLKQAQASIIEEIYQISGMSDVIRGASNPNETATAQQIKGQFATLRLQDRQQEVQRFARDLIALKGEIISEHFTPESFALVSGYQFLIPDLQVGFEPALKLLRDDKLRTFRIDIETDSMISMDESQDKQDRIDFLNAAGQFMAQGLPLIQQTPAFATVAGEMLMFGVRGFRTGKALESSMEQALDMLRMQQQQQMQQPPPPDPLQMELQGKMQIAQLDMQLKQQEAQQDLGIENQKLQMEQQKLQHQMQLDIQKLELELKKIQEQALLESQKLKAELELQAEKVRGELALKAQDLEAKRELEAQKIILGANNEKESEEREEEGLLKRPIEVKVVLPEPTVKKVVMSTDQFGNRVGQIFEESQSSL